MLLLILFNFLTFYTEQISTVENPKIALTAPSDDKFTSKTSQDFQQPPAPDQSGVQPPLTQPSQLSKPEAEFGRTPSQDTSSHSVKSDGSGSGSAKMKLSPTPSVAGLMRKVSQLENRIDDLKSGGQNPAEVKSLRDKIANLEAQLEALNALPTNENIIAR